MFVSVKALLLCSTVVLFWPRSLPAQHSTPSAIRLSVAQSSKKPTEPALRELSSDQLKACLVKKACGTDDHYAISDELVRRLPELTNEQLLECFDDGSPCGVWEDRTGWPISDELARRGSPHELLVRYWIEHKWTIRSGIEHVAYHFDGPEVTSFMRSVLAKRMKDGEDLYWPVNYLAKQCDPTALRQLSTGRYRNEGSLQYQTSVELFGECKYRPAIPYLVQTAVYDFSLNIVIAADDSLHSLYPDGPKDFDKLENMQRYYCGRARNEGFSLRCTK
jgi:hypothetical protein